MIDNLKNWFRDRVIEPSTMAGLAIILQIFFPGQGENIEGHLMTLFETVPVALAAAFALAGMFMKERGRKARLEPDPETPKTR